MQTQLGDKALGSPRSTLVGLSRSQDLFADSAASQPFIAAEVSIEVSPTMPFVEDSNVATSGASGYHDQQQVPSAHASNDHQSLFGPKCRCKRPSVKHQVLRNSPNKGREFFCCVQPRAMQCGFFKWANDGECTPSALVKCFCKEKAKVSVVGRDGVNKGRPFFACSKEPDTQCDYFLWKDTICNKPHPLCECGATAVVQVVKKNTLNRGKRFFACAHQSEPGCEFFSWV